MLCCFRLEKEEELSEFKVRAEELEKENLEIANNLAKKEQELDVKTQEKEDLESNLERTKEKLETETARHAETKQRLAEIEGKIGPGESLRLTSTVKPAVPPSPAPPPPMAPPPPPGPPPPPSIGMKTTISLNNGTAKPVIKRNVPQSSNPLKSFNWSKLPDCKVSGTIWTELDETKLYKAIDLAEVDKLFSAYQKNGVLVIFVLDLTYCDD